MHILTHAVAHTCTHPPDLTGLCLARVPVNGRNFEYVSGEDPYLGEQMSKPLIQGIQSNNVIANAKHFVNNNQGGFCLAHFHCMHA